MKPENLISRVQGGEVLKRHPELISHEALKPHEIGNLRSFCEIMKQEKCRMKDFDDFYAGYVIRQIGKEFDLLKFSKDTVLNIELKTQLDKRTKKAKILKQMRTNHYYLNCLNKKILIYTYVENDGFYRYSTSTRHLSPVPASDLARVMHNFKADHKFIPDQAFLPVNFLISPFTSTSKFLSDQYFLTTAQNAIRKEVFKEYAHGQRLFSLHAESGTGKTLLTYDIAKSALRRHMKIQIVSLSMLNEGQLILKEQHAWPIITINDPVSFQCDMLIIDDAQRLTRAQLSSILNQAKQNHTGLFLSYDPTQARYTQEVLNLSELLKDEHFSAKKLTTKIRTNPELSAFLECIMTGRKYHRQAFPHVSLSYFDQKEDLYAYLADLSKKKWTVFNLPYANENEEYVSAAIVMDNTFYYHGNRLHSHQAREKQIYDMISRTISDLQIVVYHNPPVFLHIYNILNHKD